jgi:hypothetical protein
MRLAFGRPAQIGYHTPAMKLKRIFKWLLALFLLGVVVLVAFLLSLDTLLRVLAVHNIKAQTGMTAELGQFHLGLLEPVITIKNLKLYNPPGFGDAPFLVIREVHVEYDRDALRSKHEIHLTLVRFDLGELDIVKNAAGQTNLMSLGVGLPSKDNLAKSNAANELKQRTGFSFTGIDILRVSVGTAKYIDLGDAKNNRAENLAIDNIPIANVKTETDLYGLMALVALRGSDVFGVLAGPVAAGGNSQLLNSLF